MLDGTDQTSEFRRDLGKVMQKHMVRLGQPLVQMIRADDSKEAASFSRSSQGFVRRHSERMWVEGLP
jgi:hypothetical protein